MSTSNKTAKSAIIIMIFTLGSKLLGFIREVLIASKFGSGIETDAFFIALTATLVTSGFIGNVITTTLIPVLTEISSKEGMEGKIEHTNNMINILVAISALIAICGIIGAPIIVKLLAKGFYGEKFELALKLTRIGLPMIVVGVVIDAFTGFLNSEERYISSAAIGFPYNSVYIIYLLFLSSFFGIKGLMVAGVIAIASQLLTQYPEAKVAGYKYKFIFDIKDKYIKKVLHLSVPVLIGVAINDLNTIIDRSLASELVTGSISALSYGIMLNTMVMDVFISAIATVIFPLLSKESTSNNINNMKRIMSKGVNLILLITIPSTVGIVVLARPIVEVAFQRGAFTPNDTIMTTQALIFYSVGLVANSLRLLINKVYYSLQDTKAPMVNGALAVGLNIILNLILVRYMAHGGLAFATSITNTVATLILFYGLKQKIGSLGTLGYIRCSLKSGLASSIMGVVVYLVYNKLYSLLGISKLYNLLSLLVAASIGVVVYGLLCYLFGVDELRDLVAKARKGIDDI